MKVWVKTVSPNLTQIVKANHTIFRVKSLFVRGRYLEDENACECGALDFNFDVPYDKLEISNLELKQRIINKLRES